VLTIFWSWQSDSPSATNRNFVKAALTAAMEAAAGDLGLSEAERPEIDHDTKDEPGLVDIVATIFKKIDSAAVFVADVTPVATTANGKFVPNPNVMIELGYALKTGHEHIILVCNNAFGGRPEDLPFDLRHRRGPITYTLVESAADKERTRQKQQLTAALKEALVLNLGSALIEKDALANIVQHPHREGDQSIWLPLNIPIEHTDPFTHQARKREVVEDTRAYMKIAPSAWVKSRPARQEVLNAPEQYRPQIFGRFSNGYFGMNSLGVVFVGLTGSKLELAHAATQWFDKTGELWGFNSRVAGIDNGKKYLATVLVLKTWSDFLKRSMQFFEHMGGLPPFRIEAGVVGLSDVHWPNTNGWSGPLALEPTTTFTHTSRKWDADAQIEFLTSTYNAMCDAFGTKRIASDAVRTISTGT
jgi:hypothetical protein